jgi:hypothetical protein
VQAIYNAGVPTSTPILSTCFGTSDDEELENIYAKRRVQSAQLLWEEIQRYDHTYHISEDGDICNIVLDAGITCAKICIRAHSQANLLGPIGC